MKRPRSQTFWLRVIRNVIAALLASNLLGLLVLLFQRGANRVIGSAMSGYFWSGPAYLQHAIPDLSPRDVLFGVPQLDHPGLLDRFLLLMPHGLAVRLVMIPILYLAYRLVDVTITADPFRMEVVGRLRRLGLVVLVGGALSELAEYLCARALVVRFVPANMVDFVDPDVNITLWWAMPAFMLLAFAEVVRRGVALRSELDTVI